MDVGTKRIGIAVSDEMLLTAQGLETLQRKTRDKDLCEIRSLLKEYSVCELVAGLPLNMDGSYSAKTKKGIEFLDSPSKGIDVPIKMWDERLTSVQAERAMLEADLSRAKRRRLSDRLAAQIILQSYLDSRKR